MSSQVTITNGAATMLNFTLEESGIDVWSNYYDFGIRKNIDGSSYLSFTQINEFLHEVANEYTSFARVNVIGYSSHGSQILELVLTNGMVTDRTSQSQVVLISGLQGDNLVGTEMLVRLIRHILKGMQTYLLLQFSFLYNFSAIFIFRDAEVWYFQLCLGTLLGNIWGMILWQSY